MTGLYDAFDFGGEQSERVRSIVTGVVKENWDDKHLGMVRVEYALGESGKNVSAWIPVMSPYAGKSFGLYVLPEIGAQVVIGFQDGDRENAIVLGSLWTKNNTVPDETANKDNSIKLLRTKAGTTIRISEEQGKEQLSLCTPAGLCVLMDDEKQSVTISDKDKKNAVELDAKGGALCLSADKSIKCKVGGTEILSIDSKQASVKAGTISLEAQQSLKVTGQSSKYEGVSVEVKASGSLKLEASGVAQVKGSMLKLN